MPGYTKTTNNGWNISANGMNNSKKPNSRCAYQPPRPRPVRAPPSQLAAGAWGAASTLIHAEDKQLYEEKLKKREIEVYIPPTFSTTYVDKFGVKHVNSDSVAKDNNVTNNIVFKNTSVAIANKETIITVSEDAIKDFEKRSAELVASMKANLNKAGFKVVGVDFKLERLQNHRVARH